MPPQTIASSAFNRDSGAAKRAAQSGPVVITERGAPSHVLMTYEEYLRLTGQDSKTIAQALAMPGVEDIPFDPPRLEGSPQGASFD